MNNIKDSELYSSFRNLSILILNYLNENIQYETKDLLSELQKNGINKIFKKYFDIYQKSDEYQKFEEILKKNDKYARNFVVPIGTKNYLKNISINQLIENIFVDYIYKHGISWKQNILDQYYHELEKFLIDDKIIVTVDTPIIGLILDNNEVKIQNEISILRLSTQRKIEFQGNTDIMKYISANCDLKIKLELEKTYEKNLENDENDNSKGLGRTIWELMVVFRLYHAGKIGFLDSNLTYSILGGGNTWQNPRCGLSNNWDMWLKQRYTFSVEEIDEIIKLGEEIVRLSSKSKEIKFIFSAMDRFMTSYEQDHVEDKILDLMISLEALLQNDIAELKYKLAIRTATFLETDPIQQNLVYKIIKEGYNVRSKTAHGAEISKIIIDKKEITLEELSNLIEDIVRRVIKKFIKKINQSQNKKIIIDNLDDNLFLLSKK
ncbi:HEPN domain-containing protein [Nitrosopumilus sp.]|uniref:HEPN domain-containing protein n=1 Tax=Nitrosopumilus sp. TaxID=2024843 RepID=UPI002930E73F|nr:HEPN domain-containing protein [Nitrosopumilus sp.]